MDKQFATQISPYAPPPDQEQAADTSAKKGSLGGLGGLGGINVPTPSWFQRPTGSQGYTSYQSGGVPTFGNDQAGITGFGNTGDEEQGPSNLWETRFGWRVDVIAAVAYIFGPFSGK
jgi:hypothetical protein